MATTTAAPVLVRMHERDNVAIVGNLGGLAAGAALPAAFGARVLKRRCRRRTRSRSRT
ncbi:MAG: hypothetical protein U1F25_11615 [Rubrivivax sp.]